VHINKRDDILHNNLFLGLCQTQVFMENITELCYKKFEKKTPLISLLLTVIQPALARG